MRTMVYVTSYVVYFIGMLRRMSRFAVTRLVLIAWCYNKNWLIMRERDISGVLHPFDLVDKVRGPTRQTGRYQEDAFMPYYSLPLLIEVDSTGSNV